MWDDSSTTLTGLAEILEAFIERWDAWNGVDAPRMHTLLPEVGETRRVALIELIKVDLEYRWVKHNLPLRIEDYLREFPELNAEAPPVDLLYEEFHVRRESGLNVDPHEFLQRFPQQATELAKLPSTGAAWSTRAAIDTSPAFCGDIAPMVPATSVRFAE